MKKLRIIFLCVVMLLSSITTTFAQSEIDVTFDKMTIHINGSVGENNAGRQVSLQIIGPFDNVTKFDDAVEKLEQGVISKLDKTNFQQVSTDSKGDFLYDFYPKQQDKFYVVAVYVDGFDKVYSKELLSTLESIKQAIIQDVNSSQDISGLSDVFANESYINTVVFNFDLFDEISQQNKAKAYQLILDKKPFKSFDGDFSEIFKSVLALMKINEEDAPLKAKNYAQDFIHINSASLYNDYLTMTDLQKETVFARLLREEIENVDKFIDRFNEAIFLQKIQSETFKTNITKLLTDNSEEMRLNLKDYSSNANTVNNAIYQQYYKKISDLNGAIQLAISNSDNNNTNNGGSGGGGSSSSGAGGSFTATPHDDNSTVIEKDLEDQYFNDLHEVKWAVEAINSLTKKKIISGTGDGEFSPNKSVSREEFIKMALLAFDMVNEKATHSFSDSSKEDWHYIYIASAVEKGIIKGISENEFGVGDPLTRQDMAVIVDRITSLDTEISNEIFFDDLEIDEYAKHSVYRLKAAGVIKGTGDNDFEPHRPTTRAEAAKLIYELIK